MKAKPAATATAQRPAGRWPEVLLDVLPTPLVVLEPGTADVLFANRAARTAAGGVLVIPRTPAHYGTLFRVVDHHGRQLALEELPGVRAARGEPVREVQLEWQTSAGGGSFVASGDESAEELLSAPLAELMSRGATRSR